MSNVFKQYSDTDVADLIDQFPLATLVTAGSEGFSSSPLPMLADLDSEGCLVNLVGHMSLNNPQVAQLRTTPGACFLFHGPHGYISPTMVPDRSWGPTWNYVLVRVEAEVIFDAGQNDMALRRLVSKMESGRPNAWSVEEMGPRYVELSRHIVAFNARVKSVDATFKLGQDERPEIFESILQKLDDPALATWMRRMNLRVPHKPA